MGSGADVLPGIPSYRGCPRRSYGQRPHGRIPLHDLRHDAGRVEAEIAAPPRCERRRREQRAVRSCRHLQHGCRFDTSVPPPIRRTSRITPGFRCVPEPQYDAVRLFVERAQTVLPDFELRADNEASIIHICRQLDGIPLALELAAARVKLLTTAQIADRLNDRFRLLTGGSRTALPRQQTLRALIDWSWQLLSASEQLLLQRLSIFAGGMDLEAVEAICARAGLEAAEILDLLTNGASLPKT